MSYSLLLIADRLPSAPEQITLCYQMLGWGLWQEFGKLPHVTLSYQDGEQPITSSPVDFTLIHSCFGMPVHSRLDQVHAITRKQVMSFLELPVAGVDHNFTYLAAGEGLDIKLWDDAEQIPFPVVRSLMPVEPVPKIPGSVLLDHSWISGQCWNEYLWEWLKPTQRVVGQLRREEHERVAPPFWVRSIPQGSYRDYLAATAPYETFIITHPGTYEHSIIDMVSRGIRVLVPTLPDSEAWRTPTFAPVGVVHDLNLGTFSNRQELLALLDQPVEVDSSPLTDMPEIVRRIDDYCMSNL